METVWGTVLPIFAVVAVGDWLTTRGTDPATLADLAVRITSPALLFSLLSDTSLDASRLGVLAGGTLAIAAGTAALAVAWLASCRLAFGPAGLEAAAIPFVTIALSPRSSGSGSRRGTTGCSRRCGCRSCGAPRAGSRSRSRGRGSPTR